MSRMGHDFSWHVFALVMVVAGLSLLAPLAWWQAHEGRSFGQRWCREWLAGNTVDRTI